MIDQATNTGHRMQTCNLGDSEELYGRRKLGMIGTVVAHLLKICKFIADVYQLCLLDLLVFIGLFSVKEYNGSK